MVILIGVVLISQPPHVVEARGAEPSSVTTTDPKAFEAERLAELQHTPDRRTPRHEVAKESGLESVSTWITTSSDHVPMGVSEAPSKRLRGTFYLWELNREVLASKTLDELILDLADDNVPRNASVAMVELANRIQNIDSRWPTRRALTLALDSTDRQQFILAYSLLQSFSSLPSSNGANFYPPERMFDIFFDTLSSWDSDYELDRMPYELSNEKTVAFALQCIDRIETRLVQELVESHDADKMLLCSYLLARARRTQYLPLVAPVLIKHLEDNQTENDALMAMEGLHALGPGVIGWLKTARLRSDQARSCAELLLLELSGPATTSAERARRNRMTHLTTTFQNPLEGWTYLRNPDYLRGFTNTPR